MVRLLRTVSYGTEVTEAHLGYFIPNRDYSVGVVAKFGYPVRGFDRRAERSGG